MAPGAPAPPPVGEERVRIIEGIRKTYPIMPDTIVELLADGRGGFNNLTRCEVLDFLVQRGSGARETMVTRARSMVRNCALGIDDITPEVAAARLAGKAFAYDVSANSVAVIARSASVEARMCCTFDVALAPIGASGFRAARRRIADTSAGILVIGVSAPDIPRDASTRTVWRGPAAPPAPARKDKAALKGAVLERRFQSAALGETRRLSIYLPPGHSKARVWPVLFLAGGAAEEFAPMVEAMIDRQEIAPIVMVSANADISGIVKAPGGYIGLGIAQYVRRAPGLSDEALFVRHMTFFSDELARYAATEFNVASIREQRAVAGFSNGATFAAWAGLQHPDRFGSVIAMSPGALILIPADFKPAPRARFIIGGGTYEPGFLEVAQRAEEMLKAGGYDVSGHYLSAGHEDEQWEIVLHDALVKLFPPA